MVAGGYGRILLVSSGAALGIANEVHYASAKAGLQGMARTLAVELGKFGVTANAIAPGFIDTEMTRSVGERRGRDFEEFKSTSASNTPVGRIGQPEDVAAAVAYLCSQEAGFVSGHVLYIRGGP